MAVYPDPAIGQRFTAAFVRSMLPDILTRSGSTSRNTTTVHAADGELAGFALGVGTWHVRMLLLFNSAAAAQAVKTQWSFSGTWNTPIRSCIGPGPAATGGSTAYTDSRWSREATNSDATYNMAATAGYMTVIEESYTVVVTVAGNLALTWAQVVSSANDITIRPGSTIQAKQIA